METKVCAFGFGEELKQSSVVVGQGFMVQVGELEEVSTTYVEDLAYVVGGAVGAFTDDVEP